MKAPHKNEKTNRFNVSDQATLRKFLIALGMIFPLVGSSAAKTLKVDEDVMFLPDIAYRDHDGIIKAGVQAWVYEKHRRRGLTRMLALFLGIDMASLSPTQRQQLYARTQLFRVSSRRGKQLVMRNHDGARFALHKTASNGRTGALIETTTPNAHKIAPIKFLLDDHQSPLHQSPAFAHYAPPKGLSVISDIDDTIRETAVADLRRLLINTFLENFVATKGVNDWYQAINQHSDVAFHYVSTSPIQLYPVLREFMSNAGYPEGSMHLREATRWIDIVPKLRASVKHKKKAIERIITAYPERSFILVGDSSEHDPCIYADFYRRFSHQVRCVLIREVDRRGHRRHDYHKIFDGIANNRWLVSPTIDDLIEFSKVHYQQKTH